MFNPEDLKNQILEKQPTLLRGHKRFWSKEFSPLINNFIDGLATIIHEEDSPFRVERCPKCSAFVVYEDKYCHECGVPFKWR